MTPSRVSRTGPPLAPPQFSSPQTSFRRSTSLITVSGGWRRKCAKARPRSRILIRASESRETDLVQQQPMEASVGYDGAPVGDVSKSCAHWVRRDVIAWRKAAKDGQGNARRFYLNTSGAAGIQPTAARCMGAEWSCELGLIDQDEQYAILSKYPHLFGCTLLKVPDWALEQVPMRIKHQVVLSCAESRGRTIDGTGVQLTGVLDDLFFYEGPLGVCMSSGGRLKVSVWAPTALKVELIHWENARGGEADVIEMEEDLDVGVWSLDIVDDWMWDFYKYRVTAYCPWTRRIEAMEATDPYSRGLCANGERSQIVNLNDKRVRPEGWVDHEVPTTTQFTDISVYELHVRDFSASDERVPLKFRGKYVAFNPERVKGNDGKVSGGLEHLIGLKEAGMTHIHLLPCYDFASVPERVEEQRQVDVDLSQFPSSSDEQQQIVSSIAREDAFNWGYDPVHYGVPEGSYSLEPDGPDRISEFREMVMGLHGLGYQVVLDVVYNHTFEAGPHSRFSVLDKIVPGYYHRREENGDICGSACGANTASEHLMFERLMVDDLVHWAKNYKVDSFRFDIMGHIMLSSMDKVQEALRSLTLEKDGVDGKKIYLYGEAWEFGEVRHNQRGRTACQLNITGKGLGAFNDRFRDSAMGGNPTSSYISQGFLNGIALQPNPRFNQGNAQEQMETLLAYADVLRVCLTGNLENYELETRTGESMKGSELKYNGQPVGYCATPIEHVSFIGCHDNYTIFDHIMVKLAPEVDIEGGVRTCEMALSLCILSQGVVFIHAGDDLLRSKSIDYDSYDSGDWFNKIDWTGQTNNFGVGLPVASKNHNQWGHARELLSDPSLVPPPKWIQHCKEHVQTFLRIRYSSPLFRLQTEESICRQLSFENIGPNQIPGVILMKLTSSTESGCVRDPQFEELVVGFSVRPTDTSLEYDTKGLELHPVLVGSTDDVYKKCAVDQGSGKLVLPKRTTVVWVKRRV